MALRRAINQGEGLFLLFLLFLPYLPYLQHHTFSPKGGRQTVLHCARRTSTF